MKRRTPDRSARRASLSEKTVAAWRDAADTYYEADPPLTELPHFFFDKWPNAGFENLPEPEVPFALWVGGVNDARIRQFARFENLQVWGLNHTDVTDVGLKEIACFQNLHELKLRRTKITGKGLAELRKLTELKRLDVYGTRVTDAGLKKLVVLENLEELDLGENGITDKGLEELSKLKELRSLSLERNKITDSGLKCLVGLQKLQRLILSGNRVTDAGLRMLAQISRLQALSLSSMPVTDTGIKHLLALENLQYLGVVDTSVTDEALMGFTKLKDGPKRDVPKKKPSSRKLSVDWKRIKSLILKNSESIVREFFSENEDRIAAIGYVFEFGSCQLCFEMCANSKGNLAKSQGEERWNSGDFDYPGGVQDDYGSWSKALWTELSRLDSIVEEDEAQSKSVHDGIAGNCCEVLAELAIRGAFGDWSAIDFNVSALLDDVEAVKRRDANIKKLIRSRKKPGGK